MRKFMLWTIAALFALVAGPVLAQSGVPTDWSMGFQEPASPVTERIDSFHNLLLWIITLISLFVLALLIYVVVKFNSKANPVPTKTSHNTTIEILWTVVPIVVLVLIAFPSIKLLQYVEEVPEADVTVKAIGYQWYWGYEYPDHEGLEFEANMLDDEEAEAAGVPRLLGTDYFVVVPVDKIVRVQVTADPTGVIHNFAMPSLGLKTDAVPGRLNETWFKANKEGDFFGQCSELCGIRHAFMPIWIKVVSQERFDAWTKAAQDDIDAANESLIASLKADAPVQTVAKKR